MMKCLAVDMGASNVRLIEVALAGGRLAVQELSRFPNGPRVAKGRHVWDYGRILREIEKAVTVAGWSGDAYASIAADSWGVDYVLIDEQGRLMCPPVAYRDPRTEGRMERYFARHIPAHDLYAATGIQCQVFNTLYQLFAHAESDPESLQQAHRLLFTADHLQYWLSGVAANERTLSSTSQMLTLDGRWWPRVLATLPLAAEALGTPVAAGTVLGPLRKELAARTGLGPIKVIAPASHDTQSAIAAVPAEEGEDWAYLSSGTWSIIGVESRVPFAGADAEAAGLGNESGYGGTYCVQATVTGLWLIQEIQRMLGQSGNSATLAAEAEGEKPFRSLIDPADPRFFNPPDMIAEICAACRAAREPVPETPGQLARCAYDSLALLYRTMLARLAKVTGRRAARLHVVGGGSKVPLLNRMCAAAAGIPVLAGPAEATALGNALAQLIALGALDSMAQGRRVIAASFPPARFDPERLPGIDDAIARFEKLMPA